ncbi:thiol-disulfide oxidoreductase DCC family protein [Pseudomonadota bacterium]
MTTAMQRENVIRSTMNIEPLITRARTVVFFDGGCPLCSKEIRHYARLDREDRMEWIDISKDRDLLAAFGITYEQAMRRLHVLDRNGVLVDGARAFLAIWSELPRYRVLSRLVYAFRALNALEAAYSRFADRRYASRCRTIACSVQTTG